MTIDPPEAEQRMSTAGVKTPENNLMAFAQDQRKKDNPER